MINAGKLLLIIFCLFFANAGALAQQIRLTVSVKEATGKQALNANVFLDSVRHLAPSRGFFFIQTTPGPHQIRITHLGFRTLSSDIVLSADTTLSFLMEQEFRDINEVSVISRRPDQNVKSVEIGKQSISINTLIKLPAVLGELDILRGLQMLPGVTSVGEGSNGLNIRGGNVDQNMMLLDGAPIYNPTHLFGLFSAIPQESIQSIDLYKGGIPSRFGGRISSVIDIAMKDPDLSSFRLDGGLGIVSSRLAADIPLVKDKMGIIIAGRASFNDFMLKWTENLKQKRASFFEGTVKYLWKINRNNTVTYSLYGTDDFIRLDNLSLNSEGSNAANTDIAYHNINHSFKWSHAFSSRFSSQVTYVSTDYRPTLTSPELTKTVSVENGIQYRRGGVNLLFNPNEKQQYEAGIQAIHYRLSPGTRKENGAEILRLPDENSLEYAAYAESNLELSSKLSANIGLRASLFQNLGASVIRFYKPGESITEDSFLEEKLIPRGEKYHSYRGLEPRLGIRYMLNESSSLKFGYNLMRQYIQIITNTTTPLPISRWKTSDHLLRPQVSNLVSLGYYRNFMDNLLEFSSEIYYRHTDHATDIRPGSDFLLKDFVETDLIQGINRSYGMELMLAKKQGRHNGWVNYTYSRTQNRVRGYSSEDEINQGHWYPSNFDKPHSFNASYTYDHTKTHTFALIFTFSSGRPYSKPEGLVVLEGKPYPIYLNRNLARIPAYHRLDFSWTIRNPSLREKKFKGTWNFTLYNLYWHKNVYSVYFQNRQGGLAAYKLSVFASIIPSLSYSFKFN